MVQKPTENTDPPLSPEAKEAADADIRSVGGETSAKRKVKLKSRSALIMIGVIAALVICGVFYSWYTGRYISTDDAQIDGHIAPMSARITGHIKHVLVDDGQMVAAGTTLVEIDPADYQTAFQSATAAYDQAVADDQRARLQVQVVSVNTANQIAEAQAGVEVSRSEIATSKQAYKEAQAEQSQAEAQDSLARRDLQRASHLLSQTIISRQRYDQYETTARSAAAVLTASRAKVEAAARQIAQAQAQLDQAQAKLQEARTAPEQIKIAQANAQSKSAAVQKARAAMEQARLNLQYTRIVAPVAGVIGNKTAQVGQNVSPGQVLMDLVDIQDVWVTANFKETQLHHVRPGQPVSIHVDAFDKTYKGRVESIGAATGEQFSLFPPENATGNFVKVVQRIPVKIVFDKGENQRHRLRPGMSVEPKVWIK